MDKIVLLDKEYDFYIRLWSKLQTVLGDELFARVDSVIMFEREQNVFGSSLEIYKPDRSYTETYSADINAQSLEFISENISSCDCGFTAEKLNLYYQFLIDSLSKLPYSVERINFFNEMGCSCKEKCPNGEYRVKVYAYPKSDLEECFKLPYSVENYYKLVNSIDSRDKNQTFSRGDYCPINVITRKALFLAKGKRVSIKDCSEGDMLMLVNGCSVGVAESGWVSSYYKGGHTVVKVGSEVNDLDYVNKEGYYSKPFISISVSGSTFYGISGGAYNTNGIMFHGFSENTVLYVADMSDGKPGYLSEKCYIKLEDYYNIMKEVIIGLKDDYGLRI